MPAHKFAVGDKVTIKPVQSDLRNPTGLFTITRLLPISGTDPEYRARGRLDQIERVFRESRLVAAGR